MHAGAYFIDRVISTRTQLPAVLSARLQTHRDNSLLCQPMALCVVIEEEVDETVVVTAHKSSKLEKSLKGDTR
jgi:hypothetical protein